MKKIIIISISLLSYINSFGSENSGLTALIEKYRVSCEKMVVGDTITYLALKNDRNYKMIKKFGDKQKKYVITKIKSAWEKKKEQTRRADWFLKEVETGKREKILVYYGNEQALHKEFTGPYVWGDEVCNYDLPFFHYEQWKKELIGTIYTHPLVKTSYEIVDVSIKFDQLVTVINSVDKKQYTYRLETANEDCFKEDLSGSYETFLAKVEKPENPDVKYGQIEVVEDSVMKYSYKDSIMTIVIYGDSNKFNFVLQNMTPYTISFPWERAIFVDMLGFTSKVMHNGVKYSEKESTLPASSIIRGAKLKDVAIPIENINYSELLDEWTLGSMYPQKPTDELYQVQLMLPIQVRDVVNDYIFTFDIRYVPNHPERFKNSAFFLEKK